MEIEELVERLYEAKRAELAVKAVRERLEADLTRATDIPPNWEGSRTRPVGDYKVKVSRTINVKVDGGQLKEIAAANGLLGAMDDCFRWKAELNKKIWREADDTVRRAFAPAMVFTPGKVSFTVTRDDEGE